MNEKEGLIEEIEGSNEETIKNYEDNKGDD